VIVVIYHVDFVQVLWAALLPVVVLLVRREERRLDGLLLKALIVYCLGYIAYEAIRLSVFPQTRDNWLVLGTKVFLVFLLLELAWEQIHPPEHEETPPVAIQVLYALGGIIGFIGVLFSFLGRA
jgi:hypothetical protein